MPTESDTASTTKLTVALPDLKSARTEPMPGWTAIVEKDPTSLVAKSVTWTADPGVGIAPGQFQQFVLSAGPLPEQEDEYSLASVGLGTRASLSKWLSGSLDWGYPLLDGPNTQKQDSRLHFSVQATF